MPRGVCCFAGVDRSWAASVAARALGDASCQHVFGITPGESPAQCDGHRRFRAGRPMMSDTRIHCGARGVA